MLSLFDRRWHKDISEAEAVELMEAGIEEVKTFECQLMTFSTDIVYCMSNKSIIKSDFLIIMNIVHNIFGRLYLSKSCDLSFIQYIRNPSDHSK